MVEIDTFYNFFCVVFSVHIPYLLMVGLNRLELLTSRLSGVRSNQLSYRPIIKIGGDEENRTPDPLLARQVLSQLSYAPIMVYWIVERLFSQN